MERFRLQPAADAAVSAADELDTQVDSALVVFADVAAANSAAAAVA